jgi:hypothetical protein
MELGQVDHTARLRRPGEALPLIGMSVRSETTAIMLEDGPSGRCADRA